MATIFELQETLSKLNIEVLAKKTIASTSNLMADLNRKQLLKGQKADGSFLDNYSRVSQDLFGKPNIPMQLKDTGAFHKSISVDVGSDVFEFIADDIHDLEKKYSNEIFGLTKENEGNYSQDILLPLIQKEIETETGLKFN
jgi:hypothetical protein